MSWSQVSFTSSSAGSNECRFETDAGQSGPTVSVALLPYYQSLDADYQQACDFVQSSSGNRALDENSSCDTTDGLKTVISANGLLHVYFPDHDLQVTAYGFEKDYVSMAKSMEQIRGIVVGRQP